MVGFEGAEEGVEGRIDGAEGRGALGGREVSRRPASRVGGEADIMAVVVVENSPADRWVLKIYAGMSSAKESSSSCLPPCSMSSFEARLEFVLM